MKPNVVVEEVVRDSSEGSIKEIRCTIEGNGVGPFSLYFPDDVSREDISMTLARSAVFLVDDLPRMMRADIRRSVIELHEEAAKNVPSFRERK